MDIPDFKQIFRKYYDKEFDNYDIEKKIIENESFELKCNKKIYFNEIKLSKNIKIKLENEDKSIVYNRFIIKDKSDIKMLVINKGHLLIYNEILLDSNSVSNFEERYVNYDKLINRSELIIEKENSKGSLNQYLLEYGNTFSVLIPILKVTNYSSKGFHGSKIVKILPNMQFYLNSLGINKKDIERLIFEDFIYI